MYSPTALREHPLVRMQFEGTSMKDDAYITVGR